MLVLEFENDHWLCRPHEWLELLQLARLGGFDLSASTEDPTHRIFSNAESSRLREALQSLIDDIPNDPAYTNKAYASKSHTGSVEKLYPYPGEKLTPLERLSGPRKERVLALVRSLNRGAFRVRPVGP